MMARDCQTIEEGDRLWPVVQIVRNTWIDDLTPDRIQEVVKLIDSWRITDAEGRRIKR